MSLQIVGFQKWDFDNEPYLRHVEIKCKNTFFLHLGGPENQKAFPCWKEGLDVIKNSVYCSVENVV